MTDSSDAAPLSEQPDWTLNYFNYFTEIEEHFQRARGSGLFLLSPLDWALIESWKSAGVPMEAVLEGIDQAFEKWRSRKNKRHLVNSLAYCAQAVMKAAERSPSRTAERSLAQAPFAEAELVRFLEAAAAKLRQTSEPAFHAIADSVEAISQQASDQLRNLQGMELRLTALEEKMVAVARTLQSDDDLFAIREALDRELRPYRGKMTAEQLSMLERRYLDTALLERTGLPRLSLFYLH